MRNLYRLGIVWLLSLAAVGLPAPATAQSPYLQRKICRPAVAPPVCQPAVPPPVCEPAVPTAPVAPPSAPAEPKSAEPVPAAPPAPAATVPPPSPPPAPDLAEALAAREPGMGAEAPAPEGEALALFNSSVGYIDTAIPGSQFRLRFDAAYDSNRPNRAEFFYARGGPGTPGLTLPETRIDYQTLSSYLEYAFRPRFSGFLNIPVRFINPEINANASGLGDLYTGFKYAFWQTPTSVATFQLKTYVPSGNAQLGLGNNHVSLEPGLLFYRQLTPCLRGEGELRYWVPVGGTDFAGDVIRYGVGLSYGSRPLDSFWVSPVAEVVGWTVLGGKESFLPAEGAVPVIDSAAGDTIVNVKAGLRMGLGERANVYAGYGRPLTGEVWYKHLWRVELRLLF